MADDNTSNNMRLARFMASAGLDSRRNCERFIEEGRVTVNGQPVLTPAFNVNPDTDCVKYEGRELKLVNHVYVMLNKPVGFTCTAADDHAQRVVFELLPDDLGRLFYIGRLDKDSEGLLLFTNDGELAQSLTHPSFQVEKTYVVDCDGVLNDAKIRFLLEGFDDDGDFLKAKSIRKLREKPGKVMAEFVLTEGRKREVRRMCARIGLAVVRLARTSFAGVKLDRLPTGEWRRLTPEEIQLLKHNVQKA